MGVLTPSCALGPVRGTRLQRPRWPQAARILLGRRDIQLVDLPRNSMDRRQRPGDRARRHHCVGQHAVRHPVVLPGGLGRATDQRDVDDDHRATRPFDLRRNFALRYHARRVPEGDQRDDLDPTRGHDEAAQATEESEEARQAKCAKGCSPCRNVRIYSFLKPAHSLAGPVPTSSGSSISWPRCSMSDPPARGLCCEAASTSKRFWQSANHRTGSRRNRLKSRRPAPRSA